MKKLGFLLSLFLLALSMNAQQYLTGVWDTGKDNTKIEISEQDGVYSGIVVSSDNAKVIPGKEILKDVKSVDGGWKGKVYAMRMGKWLDANLEEKGDLLLVSVKAGLMRRTLEWEKE